VERAQPGTRTAVNLAGIDRESLRRGMVLARPGGLAATGVVDARLRALGGIPHALRHNAHVTFYSGSDEANAVMRLLDEDQLAAGREAWAQIKLERPVAVMRGDRFVLRTTNETVAGGTIVAPSPKRHRRNHTPTIAALEALANNDPARVLLDAIAHTPMIGLAALQRPIKENRINDAVLDELVASGNVARMGEGAATRYASKPWLSAATDRIVEAVAEYHRRHPLRPGMPIDEIRTLLKTDSTAAALVVSRIDEVRLEGATVASRGFKPAPSPAEQQAVDVFLAELRRGPVVEPAARLSRELMAHLVEAGAIIEASGVLIEADAFSLMQERIRARIADEGAISLAQARDLLGTNRRIAQAFLEHLDRLRVTRRVGDKRVLR
jgi:selenocysteine-specific elongation factor